MTRLQKTYELSSFKAFPVGDDGLGGGFEAIVSVFGNVDYQGDRMMPGSFKNSIAKWRESGDPVPIIWSHDWGNPMAHIGKVSPTDMEEVEATDEHPAGLKVRGALDIDKPFAKQVYDLLKERRVKEFSFAYDVVAEEPGPSGETNVLEVDLIEVGPTLKGANPETVSLGVKSRLERAAKVETSSEILAAAMAVDPDIAKALGAQISEAAGEDPDWSGLLDSIWEEKAEEETEEKAEEPEGAKAGKVIGAKAAAALKERLSSAVDTFVSEVNGTVENETPAEEEKSDEPEEQKSEEQEEESEQPEPEQKATEPVDEDLQLIAQVEDLARTFGVEAKASPPSEPSEPATSEELNQMLDGLSGTISTDANDKDGE